MIRRGDAFALLERVLGFRPEPTRGADVERAIVERLRARDCDDAATYALLIRDPIVRAAEARILADRVTVNETYFLREPAHLEVLSRKLLPAHVASGRLPIRVLSVGCSTGEEPYGIALTLLDAGITRRDAEIVAIDASPGTIERARNARYSEWSLRNVEPPLRARYFRKDKNAYLLSDQLRDWVRFEVENLIDEASTFWDGAAFDVIFCRNVLIYFTPSAIELAVGRLARALAPEGHLFLGHAETGLASKHLAVQQAHGAFYFELPAPQPARTEVRPEVRNPATWVETIARSSTRTQALESAPPVTSTPEAPREDAPERVFELLRLERFSDALALLESAEPRSESGLLKACVLTNLGRIDDAAAVCALRLETVPHCPFAHYLLGLCQEQAERLAQAREHYARASALEPSFALPRLRGGMLARRAGDRDEARRLLREALESFARQGARVQLLYGGGIATEALEALCRAEITACEKVR